MAVDEDNLKLSLESAHKKLTLNGIQRTKLKHFINNCTEISKKPTEADPEIMKDVMDNKLGTTMTDDRREQEYDKLMIDKKDLGL